MASIVHLARRFFGSLRPGPPRAEDEEWVRSLLLPGEVALWARMSNPDRRHAAGVARQVAVELGSDATRPVLAAALLHDVGKVESGLRTPGRVVATVVGQLGGHERAQVWAERSGYTARVGRYLLHADLGADLLTAAGSDPLTVAWAREHHRSPSRWTLPTEIATVLATADDD